MSLKIKSKITRKTITIASLVLTTVILGLSVVSYLLVGSYGRYIDTSKTAGVIIVFGGGVYGGQPLPLLKERLTEAARLYESKTVKKIIVSGDNRTEAYNEPMVMMQFLIDSGVPKESIQSDYAGRSTFETCERARKVFLVDRAILVSEASHLPRALFLCRQFGVEAYGSPSDAAIASKLRISQRWREVLARTKAVLNVYTIGEQTILGEPIPVE